MSRQVKRVNISGKEDKSNKVSSWSNTTTDTHYPSEKLVKDSLDGKANSTHTHTINLNSSNVYDADNWTTIDGDAPTITSDSIQANAVSHHILNKEFVGSKYYTLTFEFNITYSNRSGLYLFGDEDCNRMFEITTDIGNTFTLQYDSNGNTTELYAGTKNHFTSGWHDIKVIRKGDTATLYIDDELYYTFNNIGNCTNLLGLLKWGGGSTTIKNVNVSLDVTELPIDDYVDRSGLEKTMIQYELTSSNYNPNVGSTITITCTCKDILGNPIANKTLELMMNGVSQGTSTTNANGIATWSITFGACGNKHFYIGNETLDFVVTGWKLVETKESEKVKVYINENMVALSIQDSFTLTANGNRTIATISSQYAPTYYLTTNFHPTLHQTKLMIDPNGNINVYNNSTATSGSARIFVTYPLKARMP